MNDLVVAIITVVVGAVVTWVLTNLPAARRARDSRRQVANVILGVEEGPGIEERPSLVKRVSGLEGSIKELGTHAKANADAASKAAEALPRIEQEIVGLTTSQQGLATSHAILSRNLQDHMLTEETVVTEARKDLAEHRRLFAQRTEELTQQVAGIHEALVEHAANDLEVSEDIRHMAHSATEAAEAARVAAEAAARAAEHAAVIDQQVLSATTETHDRVAAISSAVGATEPPPDPEQRRRRQR